MVSANGKKTFVCTIYRGSLPSDAGPGEEGPEKPKNQPKMTSKAYCWLMAAHPVVQGRGCHQMAVPRLL